jgi:hypothetical protein
MKENDKLVNVECTPHQRYCARYGLSPVLCICKSDLPDKINLEVLQEFCWFATKEVTDMDNSNKQNMLYWWYMTNIYNIGGKGVTKERLRVLRLHFGMPIQNKTGNIQGTGWGIAVARKRRRKRDHDFISI